uniref:Protein kinase domain-containing protein n=1 Tax=Seriola lalandi dorsalis TaxID=1841481 RepID=A0A3B4WZF1_SERLL
MLHVDPEKRITPSEALGHRFITMKHLPSDANPNPYVSSSYLKIKECQLEESSVEFKRFVTSSEVLSWNGASITSLDEPLTADEETVACTNDESPHTAGLDEANNTCSNSRAPATSDRTAADNNDRPPGKADIDDNTAAETDKKPTGMTETTSPASPVSHDSENGYLQIEKYDVLSGKQSGYLIRKFLGMGAFGQVVQCIKLDTKDKMAVKIVRKDETWVGKREVTMLEKLRKLDQDKNNLIKFTEHFEHKGHVCIAFEMLDISVEDLIEKISSKPLYLSEIRVIAQQMLVALDALKSIGLAHGDIKPDNIMLVNHQLQPFKVKLIDFGLAIPISKMQAGTVIQTIGYRAPEVML